MGLGTVEKRVKTKLEMGIEWSCRLKVSWVGFGVGIRDEFGVRLKMRLRIEMR